MWSIPVENKCPEVLSGCDTVCIKKKRISPFDERRNTRRRYFCKVTDIYIYITQKI